ncbi:DoxX family protein [Paenibacillus alkalitolerans]|uniref:DoxX family protein n=1 Tax=Paenibacillus alkalitolerans TaxID=2799335 RepID=UPI0018F467AB|nr:DoxX family protein [Paenibacillus alkalitolerans]
MFTAYIIFTILAIASNAFSATMAFIRFKQVVVVMEKVGVPTSWMFLLGVLKAAGALGLLVGFAVPLIGAAAAIGIILFFVAAIFTHLRARDYSIGYPTVYLLFAVGTLVFQLETSPHLGFDLAFDI